MNNGMPVGIRRIVAGLAAVATSALLLSSVVNSFDTRLLTGSGVSEQVSAVIAALGRPALASRV